MNLCFHVSFDFTIVINWSGIDYLSIAAFSDLVNAHRVLLGNGIIAVEGLNMTSVEPGNYEFICLPLRLPGSDGSPVRAILIQ